MADRGVAAAEQRYRVKALSQRQRLAIALTIGLAAGTLTWLAFQQRPDMLARDFTYPLRGALAVLDGQNPYEVIRPAGPPPYDYPFMYPLTAAIAAIPFALLPMQLAGVVFVILGVGALAYFVSGRGPGQLWVVLSVPFIMTVVLAQWGPLMMAGTMTPILGWALAAKPTIGLALFAYRPDWRTGAVALALTGLAFVVQPGWLADWFAAVKGLPGHPIPASRPLGFLAALALIKWRKPEARLVGVMALVPQNLYFYDQLALWLVARNGRTALALTITSWLALLATRAQCGDRLFCGPEAELSILGLIYLPAAIIALSAPNSEASPEEKAA